jgi:hypothetical protein
MFVVFHHPQSRYARKAAIEVCFVVNPPLKAILLPQADNLHY